MSVKLEKISGCRVKLSFQAKKEDFNDALDKAIEARAKEANIPGFRKGHVSKDVYIKKFGKESCYNDAIDTVINNEYYKAIVSKKLQIVGQPSLDVDPKSVGEDKVLKFTMEVDVYPDVKLGEYKGVEVAKEKVSVSKKEVTEYIDRILKQHSELEIIEGEGIELGNTAVFDFEGFVDGVAFEGGKAEKHSLEIGSGGFIPGFEDQMVGMKVGEAKDVVVKFPDEYHAENLKGKEATFKVKVHEIKQKVTPELTDEFVAGELDIEDVKTVAEYNKFVKTVIKKDKQEASDNKFKSDVIEKIVEGCLFDIPEGMINDEVDRQVKQIENQAKMYGMTVDMLLQYSGMEGLEKYKETIRPSAQNAVSQRVVLAEIGKQEKINVTKKEYQKEIDQIVKETKKTEEEVKNTYTLDAIKPYMILQKAYELVIKEAVDTNKKKVEEK